MIRGLLFSFNIYISIPILFLIIFIPAKSELYSQIIPEAEILAQVGTNFITKQEFENRLNFYPKEGIQDKNNNQGIKRELLYTLIAEKLWSKYALENDYESKLSVVTAKNVIEKMFVRDALYKIEIKDKITVTEEYYANAESRHKYILDLFIYYGQEVSELENIYKTLTDRKSSNESLSLENTEIQSKRLGITYGDLPLELENILYDLEKDEFTSPIKQDKGWAIYHLIEKSPKEYNNEKERIDSYKALDKIISRRREDSRYEDFHNEFFRSKKIDADGKLFNIISKRISDIFTEKYENGLYTQDKYGNDLILLDSEDLRLIEQSVDNNYLQKSFIKFDINPINLITFLREASFQSFGSTSPEFETVKHALNKKLSEYIREEMLAREGYRRGLDQLPDVQKWVKIWYENFLYQAVRNDQLKEQSEQIDSISMSTESEIVDSNKYSQFVSNTISLSKKYGITINQELLDEVYLDNINLFVVRNLGFGGTIAAVPSSPPFIDWYIEKEKRDLENL